MKKAGFEPKQYGFWVQALNHYTTPPDLLDQLLSHMSDFLMFVRTSDGSISLLLLLVCKGKLRPGEGRRARSEICIGTGVPGSHACPLLSRSSFVGCLWAALSPWALGNATTLYDRETFIPTVRTLQRKFHLISQIKTYFWTRYICVIDLKWIIVLFIASCLPEI